MSKSLTVHLLGKNPVTNAVGKALSLFGVQEANDTSVDILVMVDGDTDSQDNNFMNTMDTLNESLIYLETMKDTHKHKLSFLAEICPTYRIPLEDFSIIELGRIIDKISKEKPPK